MSATEFQDWLVYFELRAKEMEQAIHKPSQAARTPAGRAMRAGTQATPRQAYLLDTAKQSRAAPFQVSIEPPMGLPHG